MLGPPRDTSNVTASKIGADLVIIWNVWARCGVIRGHVLPANLVTLGLDLVGVMFWRMLLG
jgi:hypothetical protein